MGTASVTDVGFKLNNGLNCSMLISHENFKTYKMSFSYTFRMNRTGIPKSV